MATPNEIAAKVLYEGLNGKAQPAKWSRAGFANWIDYDSVNNVIKYGDYTFNPQQVFGLKITDKGSWEEKVQREQEAMKAKLGNQWSMLQGLMGQRQGQDSISTMMQRQAWEKNRKEFTWKDPASGKVYTETGSGDTLLPMSQAFAQMIADATWANARNGQASRWGKSPDGQGKSPYEKANINNGRGRNPRAGLLA